jgi:hypothetical protein
MNINDVNPYTEEFLKQASLDVGKLLSDPHVLYPTLGLAVSLATNTDPLIPALIGLAAAEYQDPKILKAINPEHYAKEKVKEEISKAVWHPLSVAGMTAAGTLAGAGVTKAIANQGFSTALKNMAAGSGKFIGPAAGATAALTIPYLLNFLADKIVGT